MNFETLFDLLRIRRIEYRIAEVPIFLMPVLLASPDMTSLRQSLGILGEGLLIFFLLFAYADMANCLADRDLDAVYKPHLSQAVYRLGLRSVTAQIIAAALLAVGITIHLAWRLDRWILVPMILIGLALGAAYSLEPVRLKSRGLYQIPCLWTIIFFGPMLLTTLLLRPLPGVWEFVFFCAYATVGTGIILINTAEDFPEDRDAGVFTCIHALGLRRGIATAKLFTLYGGILTLLSLGALYGKAHLPLFPLLVPLLATSFVWYSIRSVYKTLKPLSEVEQILRVKDAAHNVPLWITLAAWSHCLATFLYFWLRIR